MDNALPPAEKPAIDGDDEVDWTGQVLGEFRVLNCLGRGGMGQVYLAEQTNLKRKVALKLLHPDLASNERSLARFKAEAENAARATHANIVQIYTIGQANGVNYIALEYVEGKNLREFIEKKGTPEISLGLHIMAQVASALQRASEFNIVHRDIKPENILLTKKGEVKVADFGLSRSFTDESQLSISQSHVAMGTPLYMSPEQVERKPVDTRTDIYAFGVTCYHMFAGTPPFKGTSPIDVAYQHVHNQPAPLAEIRPDLPTDLCAMIQKMMAKKPEERYQNAREIVRDINRLREALNLGAISALSISNSFIGTASDALRVASTQPLPESAKSSAPPWRFLLIGSVLLALAAGVGLGWYQNSRLTPKKDEKNGHVQPPVIDPNKDKKIVSTKEREKLLRERVEEHLNPDSELKMTAGLQARLDLGLFFLKHRRFKDADEFFRDMSRPDHPVRANRLLGKLGHAMVLAFEDNAEASNKEFLAVIAELEKLEATKPLPAKALKKEQAGLREDLLAYRLLWKENPAIREMVAKALDHNWANDRAKFPTEQLDKYRFPPRPKLAGA